MHDQTTLPFSTNSHIQSSQNYILNALPKEDYEWLLPLLETVTLPHGKFIYQPGEQIEHVYFPISGMISVTSTMEDGKCVEVGTVGKEGMTGIDVIHGVDRATFESMVQIPGAGFRIKADDIRHEFKRCGALQDLLLRYSHAFMVQASQAGVCNRLHTIEQKLSTWMMICRDRVESDTLLLTHEFIATMLGVNRPTVSTSASTLQSEGLISYSRGKINVLDAKGLEKAACQCYQTIKAAYAGLPN